MSIKITKGGRISLSKEDPSLSVLKLGLGWKPRLTDGKKFDVDASMLLLKEDGTPVGEAGFIYFDNKEYVNQSIIHKGDNLEGSVDGDAENIIMYLDKIPENVARAVIAVNIHDADVRNQNFGQIDNAYIRLVNDETNTEIASFDLSEDSSTETCMIFAEVYRKDGTWRTVAKGEGFAGGLGKFLESYGFDVE